MIRKNPYKDFDVKNIRHIENKDEDSEKKIDTIVGCKTTSHEQQILISLHKKKKKHYKTYSFYLETDIVLEYEKLSMERGLSLSETINHILKNTLAKKF